MPGLDPASSIVRDVRNSNERVPEVPLTSGFKSLPDRVSLLQNGPNFEGWEKPFAAARKLERKGDLTEAAKLYETLLQQGFTRPEIYHRLAVCFDQTNRSQQSLPLYERALELDPANPEILCDLGFRLQLVGNNPAAERFYLLAIQYSPKHSRANNNLGVMLAQDNREDEAFRYFRAGGLNFWQAKRNVSAAVHNLDTN